MSSNDSMSMVFKCLSKGAVDFLVKPLRKNELKNLWQHVWRRCHSVSFLFLVSLFCWILILQNHDALMHSFFDSTSCSGFSLPLLLVGFASLVLSPVVVEVKVASRHKSVPNQILVTSMRTTVTAIMMMTKMMTLVSDSMLGMEVIMAVVLKYVLIDYYLLLHMKLDLEGYVIIYIKKSLVLPPCKSRYILVHI